MRRRSRRRLRAVRATRISDAAERFDCHGADSTSGYPQDLVVALQGDHAALGTDCAAPAAWVLSGTRGHSTALEHLSTSGVSHGTAGVLECVAAAAWQKAARAVLSCAGAYVSGDAGSNECPVGFTRIANQAACRTAATAAGKTVGSPFVGTYVNYPRGCYYSTSNDYAYFNPHAVGAGDYYSQLLCAALATTGAPPPHRCARECAPAWSVAQ
jgi:hypothetical protein